MVFSFQFDVAVVVLSFTFISHQHFEAYKHAQTQMISFIWNCLIIFSSLKFYLLSTKRLFMFFKKIIFIYKTFNNSLNLYFIIRNKNIKKKTPKKFNKKLN
jgi:hypothetical protein